MRVVKIMVKFTGSGRFSEKPWKKDSIKWSHMWDVKSGISGKQASYRTRCLIDVNVRILGLRTTKFYWWIL
jgi:hypothetical protein